MQELDLEEEIKIYNLDNSNKQIVLEEEKINKAAIMYLNKKIHVYKNYDRNTQLNSYFLFDKNKDTWFSAKNLKELLELIQELKESIF
jgi:hypothetical protein